MTTCRTPRPRSASCASPTASTCRRCSPICARELGVRALLCEGGPRLHAQLIDADLVDELFVTHAPKLAGGVGPGLVSELSERERDLELGWLLAEESTGELFGRYLTGA